MQRSATKGAVGAAVLVAVSWCGWETLGAKPADDDVGKFMRAKLAASQSVLEGIVTEDFDKVAAGADKMLVMSKATEWHVIQGPVYAQYSAEFRRNVEDLQKAAKEKNIDAVGLRYVGLTMSCISCHKFVRGTKVAANEPLGPGLERALALDLAPRR